MRFLPSVSESRYPTCNSSQGASEGQGRR